MRVFVIVMGCRLGGGGEEDGFLLSFCSSASHTRVVNVVELGTCTYVVGYETAVQKPLRRYVRHLPTVQPALARSSLVHNDTTTTTTSIPSKASIGFGNKKKSSGEEFHSQVLGVCIV